MFEVGNIFSRSTKSNHFEGNTTITTIACILVATHHIKQVVDLSGNHQIKLLEGSYADTSRQTIHR
jgi:hypothetical protein